MRTTCGGYRCGGLYKGRTMGLMDNPAPAPYPAPQQPRQDIPGSPEWNAARGYRPLPPQMPYGYYQPPPPPRPFSQLAIAGFIASLVSLGILGLPLSIAGLVATQRHNLRGTVLAVLGIILGTGWAIFNVSFLAALVQSGS
jgi:hypothetical protein